MTKCLYCPHHCDISEGSTGRCAMYTSSNNEIIERYPDHWLVVTPVCVDHSFCSWMAKGKIPSD
ncbi:MAG: hypothetical protein GXY48_07750 [Methanomicrobiales archaeon]|nr:hypothetical protein [Methanomicrobiales archaeon]